MSSSISLHNREDLNPSVSVDMHTDEGRGLDEIDFIVINIEWGSSRVSLHLPSLGCDEALLDRLQFFKEQLDAAFKNPHKY